MGVFCGFFGVCPKGFMIISEARHRGMNCPCLVLTNVAFVCVGCLMRIYCKNRFLVAQVVVVVDGARHR